MSTDVVDNVPFSTDYIRSLCNNLSYGEADRLSHWIEEMKMIRAMLATATILATISFAPVSGAFASEGACGYYAFAGAFSSRRSARNRARRVGGQVFDLDASDSPNAGSGLWVVGRGPGGRGWANRQKRKFQRRGVRDAYVAARCMYG